MSKLKIDNNPLVADLVEMWIIIRRERMAFDQKVIEKLEIVKREVALFHSAIRKEEKKDKDQEDDWVDIQEDKESKVFILKGKQVAESDVHNMLHFAMKSQLMMDSASMKFMNETSNIKAGKVNLPKTKLLNS